MAANCAFLLLPLHPFSSPAPLVPPPPQVLVGHPDYEVTAGTATFKGKDLLALEPEERSHLGLFLSFQTPIEVWRVGGRNRWGGRGRGGKGGEGRRRGHTWGCSSASRHPSRCGRTVREGRTAGVGWIYSGWGVVNILAPPHTHLCRCRVSATSISCAWRATHGESSSDSPSWTPLSSTPTSCPRLEGGRGKNEGGWGCMGMCRGGGLMPPPL